MRNKQKGYKETKNYIHNELGISKEVIESMLEKHINKLVSEKIEQRITSQFIASVISNRIVELVNSGFDNGKYTIGPKDKFKDYIANEIHKEIKAQVHSRINFNSITLDVNLK